MAESLPSPEPRMGRNRKDGSFNPQFINLTNSTSMDKSSRTKVRVQVMREYHRKRIQNENDRFAAHMSENPQLLSAKSQTRKFRLSREKILKPWIPVKLQSAKRLNNKVNDGPEKKQKRRRVYNDVWIEFDTIRPHAGELNKDSVLNQGMYVTPNEGCELQWSSFGNLDTVSPETILPQLDFAIQNASLYQSPASKSMDPFSAMSLPITPRTQLLLHHYFSDRLYSSWLMMPMRRGMFSLAIQDTALFHTFMSHYVARYNIHFQIGDPTESIYHRSRATKLVNQKLENPNQALTDSTIAAVANMAVYESSNGTASSLLVHLNGLVGMVNMRGGIQHGGFAPNVQRLLVWTDLHCALALSARPRFPPTDMPFISAPNSITYASNPATTPLVNLFSINQVPVFDELLPQFDPLDYALSGIKDLAIIMQAIRTSSLEPQENIWYSDKIYYLQRLLYEIIHRSSSQLRSGIIDSAGAIVALIYCCNCLRDIPLRFQVIANQVTRLKEKLDLVLLEYIMLQNQKLDLRLFWILTLGGSAAEGKWERAWFVAEFKKASSLMGIRSWESAKAILEDVLWHPELDGPGRGFWDEAMSPQPGMEISSIENY